MEVVDQEAKDPGATAGVELNARRVENLGGDVAAENAQSGP